MREKRLCWLLVCGFPFAWFQANVAVATECDRETAIARFASVVGHVLSDDAPAQLNALICADNRIVVGQSSRASIVLLSTETTIRIDQESQFRVLEPPKPGHSVLDLLRGAIYLFSREPRELDIYTPFANASVEGTEFVVRVEEDRTQVTVLEGLVLTTNDEGSVQIDANQAAVAIDGEGPRLVELIRPKDSVQWAVYYQPILAAFYDPKLAPLTLRSALEGLDYRNPAVVIERLQRIPSESRDTFYDVFLVAWQLAVGQTKVAREGLDKILKARPNNGLALALAAIVSVKHNDKALALQYAEQAVEKMPQSAATWLSLSYANQAQFDLDSALDATEEAGKRDPDNALVFARLSELWLAKGNRDQALFEAEKASTIADISRTQTVLGFAHLSRFNIVQAREAFERAIDLDQADPLPRLGLGLTKIRVGELAAGREDLAIAVNLDPFNALFRSYLGRAYFEEHRSSLATTQYDIAKVLDPFDPTPWLYDALSKQSQNRPVEALHAIQKSIELNDNRAVYRSRLSLVEDQSVRSAKLASIYRELGFDALALVEGWKSVAAAPGEFAGHRFLADSYARQPRHQIARVSELLQSQLRQPLNTSPIQPQLAESNLFVLADTGPSDPGFNEFGRLFTRDGIFIQGNVVAGGNSTVGDDVVVSSIRDNVSLSAGQFYYETDGYRENNDLKTDIYNFFAQSSITSATSVQTELRFFESESGDLPIRFGPENFTRNLRLDEQRNSARVGFRHEFSPYTDVIGNFGIQDGDATAARTNITSLDVDSTIIGGELQSLHTTNKTTFIAGWGYVERNQDDTFTLINAPIALPPIKSSADTRSGNAYVYSRINTFEHLSLTLGASFEAFEDESQDIDENRISPKLGVLWSPTPALILRAAAFRMLSREFVSDQTIEPTQIAGFNQYFDDTLGADGWRYGVAADYQFTNTIFGGIEYSERDLEEHGIVERPVRRSIAADFKERTGRGYAYWTPLPWLALRAHYAFEKFSRDRDLVGPESFIELDTQRFAVGGGLFHSSGLTATLDATHVDQKGEFAVGPFGSIDGQDDFWVLDAAIGYRFANERGQLMLIGKNIFDKSFSFQDTDPTNPRIAPDRLFLLRLSLFF